MLDKNFNWWNLNIKIKKHEMSDEDTITMFFPFVLKRLMEFGVLYFTL